MKMGYFFADSHQILNGNFHDFSLVEFIVKTTYKINELIATTFCGLHEIRTRLNILIANQANTPSISVAR